MAERSGAQGSSGATPPAGASGAKARERARRAGSRRPLARRVARRVAHVACLVGAVAAAMTPGGAAASDSIEIRGLTFVSADPEGRPLVVSADRARIDPRSEVAHLESVHITVGDGDGVGLSLECLTAEITLRDQAFRLEGEVVGVDAEGRRFEADWVEYDPGLRVLRTTAPVQMQDGRSVLSGGAFEYLLDQRRMRLVDGATVERRAP